MSARKALALQSVRRAKHAVPWCDRECASIELPKVSASVFTCPLISLVRVVVL